MTKKPSKKKSQPTTLGVIIALIIAVIAALQSAQQTNAPAPTQIVITQMGLITATAAPVTQVPNTTSVPVSTSNVTRPPTIAPPTNPPDLEITPINGALYEVTGSVSAFGCPDSRCKEITTYKKGNIVVVTGSVIGTTYKTKKTNVWYQIVSHDGSRIYVHGAYIKPHDGDR